MCSRPPGFGSGLANGPGQRQGRVYDALPGLSSLGEPSDPASYAPLPDGWVIGTADVTGSGAIAEGRCKTANMVGAAVILAQIKAG